MSNSKSTRADEVNTLARKSNFTQSILVFNAGSSSIKFALYQHSEPLKLLLQGEIEKLGGKISPYQGRSARSTRFDSN
jgi:hypothetical protein